MNFKQFNLDARLDAGIAKAGYQEPTPIQTAVIPAILADEDVIATAQTGTGKTAAFALPILNKLLDGLEGKLTSSKWAKLARTSQDTALRDIQDLIAKNMLVKDNAGGRSTGYLLAG